MSPIIFSAVGNGELALPKTAKGGKENGLSVLTAGRRVGGMLSDVFGDAPKARKRRKNHSPAQAEKKPHFQWEKRKKKEKEIKRRIKGKEEKKEERRRLFFLAGKLSRSYFRRG